MQAPREERGPPSAIELNVYTGLQITAARDVYLVLQCGSEKFTTAEKAAPSPQWNESCRFTIKHSHLGIATRPPEHVTITLREKDASALGVISISIAKLGSERTKKTWATLESADGQGDSPGKISYDCWVAEYGKPRRSSIMDAISPRRAPKPGASAAPTPTPAAAAERTGRQRPRSELWTVESADDLQREDRSSMSASHSLSGSASELRDSKETRESKEREREREKFAPPSPFRPEVTGISPTTGPGAGGIVVTVRGAMLGQNLDDIVSLSVCDIDCTGTLTYFSPSMLKFVLRQCPVRRELSGPIIVTTKNGGAGQCDLRFTYSAPFTSEAGGSAPEVSGISPMYGPAGGGTSVRIFGSALGIDKSDLISLTICGIEHRDTVTRVTPRMIQCTTLSGHGSGAIVAVTRSGGVGSSVVHYSYNRRLVMRGSAQDDDDDSDHTSPVIPPREPDTMSKEQLEAEVDLLRKTITKMEDQNLDLKKYIDRLITKLLELDPTGSFFEHCAAEK